ncbi:unnamed protein product [Miscanthus lutarioriparius]|uniref:Uncharacterized protein n=1 Tax=Miscanthus lutarioriparius TaxID=422564 RepID=A0A811PI00_9POAL|nr:unnamed protein product [Miscanthus lutarioriparius]
MEDEEAPELISPRISFSHDLVATPPPPAAALAGRRSDASLLESRLRFPAEPEFDFANAVVAAAADDVAPADRLFAGGKLLPMPPLPPPAPKPTTPCKPQACRVKAKQQACQQQIRRPGSSWASPFSRSSSVNSGTTTTTGAPRSAGKFGCPPFPLMRSWSVGSAAASVARDGAAAALGGDAVVSDAAGHRPHHHQYYKKFGGAGAATGSSRAYYYGGSRKGSSGSGSHGGVRVRPVLNVSFIGTSVSNVLSYLLCDCSHSRTKKSREF